MEININNINRQVQTNKPVSPEGSYKVQKGDTLYSLSKKFNTSINEFKKYSANKELKLDNFIKVPTVKFETTFFAIAQKYNMKVEELKQLNPQIQDFSKLHKGDIINVPFKPFEKDEVKPVKQPKQEKLPSPAFNIVDPRKVVLADKNGKIRTVSAAQLIKDAQNATNSPVKRPAPVLDAKGRPVADVQTFTPTGKGPLKGKTIIVNAGHGGYNPRNGSFDIGTHSTDAKGKVIEEWYKNKNFTDQLIPKLTSKGAKVIFMSGSALNIVKEKAKYKKADLFISIHCDSCADKTANGQTIIYLENDKEDKKLAAEIEKNINKHRWIKSDKVNSRSDKIRPLGVLRAQKEMPSVLIETGYQSNKKDLMNIDSETFRDEFTKHITDGIIDYFKNK